jgi:hypothetical protein
LDYIKANLSQQEMLSVLNALTVFASFEVDGLGKVLREGWAICNGNNGTDNLTGRVGIGLALVIQL